MKKNRISNDSLFIQKKIKVQIQKQVIIYTDGACLGNPGPGGYGAILKYGKHIKELSAGFRHTTNNRMEIMAAIEALKSLKPGKRNDVTIYSDSQLLVNAMTKGWAVKWGKNGWKRNRKDKALNPDLWEKLLDEVEKHDVRFIWIKGHADIPENERCDELSKKSAQGINLLIDTEYEKENPYS
jgi:ribonuclease HI